MKAYKIYLYLLLFIICSCDSNSGKRKLKVSDSTAIFSDQLLRVKKVVDGDTFWVDDNSSKGLKIRMIGVDAPESRKTFKKEIGYFGKESKAYLTDLLLGKFVKLEFDVDHIDKYGRTLAYVYLEDGTFVNAELVKKGYAVIMTIPPNVKYSDDFLNLQIEARDNKRGLWNK